MISEKLNEKIIEDKVNRIKSWDKNSIVDLKEMIEELDLFLEKICSERKIHEYIDFSDLPSCEFDFEGKLCDQRHWLIDSRGWGLLIK